MSTQYYAQGETPYSSNPTVGYGGESDYGSATTSQLYGQKGGWGEPPQSADAAQGYAQDTRSYSPAIADGAHGPATPARHFVKHSASLEVSRVRVSTW